MVLLFQDRLCYLCLVFVVLSRLFIVELWSPEGKGLLTLVCGVYCDFVAFSFDILGRMWCLIVSLPDPYCLSYFYQTFEPSMEENRRFPFECMFNSHVKATIVIEMACSRYWLYH